MNSICKPVSLRLPANVHLGMKVLTHCVVVFVLGLTGSACMAQEIYSGHPGIARVRGVELHSGTLSNADASELKSWGNNEVRYQLYYAGPAYRYSDGSGVNKDQDLGRQDLANYQAWLQDEVENPQSDLNRAITFCAQNKMKIVIDLQSPPGDSTADGPYRIFVYRDDLSAFYADWALIASHYSLNGNVSAIPVAARKAIWGYDLCNEPDDNPAGSEQSLLADWNQVDSAAAAVVRQYDNTIGSRGPDHAVIVECSQGYPPYFPRLKPLPSSVLGVVYSAHMYEWYQYTFQGLPTYPPVGAYTWPANANGTIYDAAWLAAFLQPVRDFQLANNVQIYIGEFSAGRYASSSNEYLNELIGLFERYGWDWNYHCFREADIWDAEMGPDPSSDARYETTDRKTLLLNWFDNNDSPVLDYNFASSSIGTGPHAYVFSPAGLAWEFNRKSGLVGDGSVLMNPMSQSGSSVAFLERSGMISQSIDWRPDCTYTVRFDAAKASDSLDGAPMGIYVGGSIHHGGLVGGTLVGAVTPSGPSWSTYTTGPFTVGSGAARLTFLGTESADVRALAFLSDVIVSGNPVQLRNPSFEFSSPTISSASDVLTPTGSEWVFSGDSGIASNGSSLNNPNSVDGTHAAFLGQNGTITSGGTIGTCDPNASYELVLSAAQAKFATPQSVAVFLDNSPIGTFTAPTSSFSTISLGPLNVGSIPPDSTGHTILFKGINGNLNSMTFLDNVRLAICSPSVAGLADDLRSQLPAPVTAANAPADAYRVLIVGDSISRHGFNADTIANLHWDHVAGMAASDESKDYAHLLSDKIAAVLNGRPVVLSFASPGEGTTTERLAPVIQDAAGFNPDLVVFQHGEHEYEPEKVEGLSATYNAVIDYVQGLPSHPKLVCVGVWNPGPFPGNRYDGWIGTVNSTMSQICADRHIPFVSVENIALDPACHGAGQNPGVQWHPNDEGHARYSDAIFQAVRPLLPVKQPVTPHSFGTIAR